MFLCLFLALAFLGAATGAPTEKCKLELEHIKLCGYKYPVYINHWEQKDYPEVVATNFTNLLTCIGPVSCKLNKLQIEMSANRIQLTAFFSENLVNCLGNGVAEKFYEECKVFPDNELDCYDKKPLNCVLDKIIGHDTCDANDVEAFRSTFANNIRFCVLYREMEKLC